METFQDKINSQTSTTPPVRASGPSWPPSTKTLLACGAVAGPVFMVVALVQGFLRAGFDFADHPLSLLSLGDLGWIQIANFVVAGVLFVACAVGMRRVLEPGRGGMRGPRLIGVFGLSLIAGGVFVADPAFGFPAGAPVGKPDTLSWHAVVHGIAPAVGFTALVVACFVLARRFAGAGQRSWAAYSVVTGVVVEALSWWPNLGGDPEGRFLPLWVAMVAGFGWASVVSARLMAQLTKPTAA